MRKNSPPYAKKSFGQNFLVDAGYIARIIAAVDPKPGETIIEIGPGRGALTEKLVDAEAHILAVELDRDLVPELRQRFDGKTNFEAIEADFLETDIFKDLIDLDPEQVKVVGNLPYYISTPILQKIIDHRARFRSAVLMLQREVVDRLIAKPGSSDRGYITVLTENAFETEKLFEVPPQAFRPAPKVHSAVARFSPQTGSIVDSAEFRRLLSLGFAHKRKTILNNLKTSMRNAAELLDRANIAPTRRAETLAGDEWARLATLLAAEQNY